MAKLVFSAVVGDARYRVGSVFFGKNAAGAFLATSTKPRDPRSTSQRGARGQLSNLAYLWQSALSQTDRQNWQTWANAHPVTDVFTHTFALSGLAAFIWVNQNIYKVGGSIRLTPPPAFSCSSPGGITVVISGAPLTLIITTTSAPAADECTIVYVTPPMSLGRMLPPKRLIICDHFAAGVAGPYDITAGFLAKYGQFPHGTRVYAQANFVNKLHGAVGTPSSDHADVP